MPIDKIAGTWYNGKFRAPGPWARDRVQHKWGALSIGKMTKIFNRIMGIMPYIKNKGFRPIILAVGKRHSRPFQHGNLITRFADFHSFTLCCHALAPVNEIDTRTVPHPTVAAVVSHRVNGFLCGLAFDALCGNLPAGFVIYFFAHFEGQPVIVAQLADRTNVNHVVYLLCCFVVFIITRLFRFVYWQTIQIGIANFVQNFRIFLLTTGGLLWYNISGRHVLDGCDDVR